MFGLPARSQNKFNTKEKKNSWQYIYLYQFLILAWRPHSLYRTHTHTHEWIYFRKRNPKFWCWFGCWMDGDSIQQQKMFVGPRFAAAASAPRLNKKNLFVMPRWNDCQVANLCHHTSKERRDGRKRGGKVAVSISSVSSHILFIVCVFHRPLDSFFFDVTLFILSDVRPWYWLRFFFFFNDDGPLEIGSIFAMCSRM